MARPKQQEVPRRAEPAPSTSGGVAACRTTGGVSQRTLSGGVAACQQGQLTPSNIVNILFFFLHHLFSPLPSMDRCYFTPFFHTVADPQGPVEGFSPRDASPDPRQSRPVRRSLKLPGPYQLHPRSVKSSFLPQKTFTDLFLLYISALHPSTSFWKLLLTPPLFLFYR